MSKPTPGPSYCQKRIYDGSFKGRTCYLKPLPGSNFCKRHEPKVIEARRAAREAKWTAEWKARNESRRKVEAEHKEQARLLALLPEVERVLTLCVDELEESLFNEGKLASFRSAVDQARALLAALKESKP